MKKISKLLYVLCFLGLIIGCSNSSASTSGDSTNTNDVSDFVKDGAYSFLFKSNVENCDDEILVNFSLPEGKSSFTTLYNGKQVAGLCSEFGANSMKEYQFLVFDVSHEKFSSIKFYWSKYAQDNYQTVCLLRIKNREKDFNLVSVTRDEVDITPKNIKKSFKLMGSVTAYKNDDKDEIDHWTKTFKPGDTITLKYQKKDNQKFDDKYYLALYNPDSYESDYVRGENNNPEFIYTFKETDIGRQLAVCIRGIEEYEGSIIPLKKGGTIGFSDFTIVEDED